METHILSDSDVHLCRILIQGSCHDSFWSSTPKLTMHIDLSVMLHNFVKNADWNVACYNSLSRTRLVQSQGIHHAPEWIVRAYEIWSLQVPYYAQLFGVNASLGQSICTNSKIASLATIGILSAALSIGNPPTDLVPGYPGKLLFSILVQKIALHLLIDRSQNRIRY